MKTKRNDNRTKKGIFWDNSVPKSSTPVSHATNFKHYCTISTAVYHLGNDLVLEFRAKTNWPITVCENTFSLKAYARIYVSVIYIFRNVKKIHNDSLFIYMCMSTRDSIIATRSQNWYIYRYITHTHTFALRLFVSISARMFSFRENPF